MKSKLQKKYTSFDALPVVLTVREVMILLRVSRANAYKIMNANDFPKFTIGKRLLVKKADIQNWIETCNK